MTPRGMKVSGIEEYEDDDVVLHLMSLSQPSGAGGRESSRTTDTSSIKVPTIDTQARHKDMMSKATR